MPNGFLADYERFGRHNDSMFGYITSTGRPVHDALLFRGRAWRTEPVGSFLQDWGFAHSLEAPVVVDGVVRATLHGARSLGDRPFGESELDTFAVLGGAVARQFLRLDLVEQVQRSRRLCAAVLGELPVAAVVTSAAATLEEANGAAASVAVTCGHPAQLRPEWAAAVRRNVAGLAGAGREAAPSVESMVDGDLGYVVRTQRVPGTEAFLSVFLPAVPRRGCVSLAPREQAIAALVAGGAGNARIAAVLGISVNTVKDHLKRMNRKLGTANRAGVAAWAQANLPPNANSRRIPHTSV